MDFPSKPNILGYHHLRNPPYGLPAVQIMLVQSIKKQRLRLHTLNLLTELKPTCQIYVRFQSAWFIYSYIFSEKTSDISKYFILRSSNIVFFKISIRSSSCSKISPPPRRVSDRESEICTNPFIGCPKDMQNHEFHIFWDLLGLLSIIKLQKSDRNQSKNRVTPLVNTEMRYHGPSFWRILGGRCFFLSVPTFTINNPYESTSFTSPN